MKIIVTGANGHLGRATIEALRKQVAAEHLAVSVREPEKAAALAQRGIEVRQGDYNAPDSLTQAFRGAEVLLLISGDAPVEARIQQHRNAIDAAKWAGVKHVVYTSIISPVADSPFTFAAIHADTEAYLRASGLAYTIFRNGLYLDALPLMIGNPLESKKIFFPGGEGKISFALRQDIAQALANVLAQPGDHVNQTYTISLDRSYSFADIADQLSRLSGQSVEYVNIPVAALEQELRKLQLPEFMVAAMTGMAQAAQAHLFDQPDNALEKLLGRKPTDLQEYLQNTYFTQAVEATR